MRNVLGDLVFHCFATIIAVVATIPQGHDGDLELMRKRASTRLKALPAELLRKALAPIARRPVYVPLITLLGYLLPFTAHSHSSDVIPVPSVKAAPFFYFAKGCDDGYEDATRLKIPPSVTVQIERTATDLFFCFSGMERRGINPQGGFNSSNVRDAVVIYLDPNHEGTQSPTNNDFAFRIIPTSLVTVSGSAASGPQFQGPGPPFSGWDTYGADVQDGEFLLSWHASLHVSLELLGGHWKTIGARFAYIDPDATGVWPSGSGGLMPSQWGDLVLGDEAALLPVITNVWPQTGETPRMLQPGTHVTITGRALDSGKPDVYFGNLQAPARTISQAATSMVVEVPWLATTGSIFTVQTTLVSGLTSLGRTVWPGFFNVNSYRNTNGFSFHNTEVHSVTFDDVTDLFGYKQTHLTIDFCWPFGCDVVTSIPNPLAGLFTLIANAALNDGQCSGFGLASQRFLHGAKPLTNFVPQSNVAANTVWNLLGPAGPTESLSHYIHVQHIAQLSSEFIHHWLHDSAINLTSSSDHIRSQIANAFGAGDFPTISIRNGTTGHVLVAYDLEDDQQGGFFIRVYDPNREFQSASENSFGGAAHLQNEGGTGSTGDFGSRIHVKSNRQWSFSMENQSSPWTGGLDTLVVTPYGVVPVQPTLPTSLRGLTMVILGDTARTSQFADSAGHRLLNASGEINRDSATQLVKATRFAPLQAADKGKDIILALDSDAPYVHTIGSNGGSSYTDTILSGGVAGRIEASRLGEELDQVSWDLARLTIGFQPQAHSKRLTATLVVEAGDQSQRSVVVRSENISGNVSVAFDSKRQDIILRNSGSPAEFAVEVGWMGRAGPPVSFKISGLRLSAADVVTFHPLHWERLGTEPIKLTTKGSDGYTRERDILTQGVAPSAFDIVALEESQSVPGSRLFTIRSKFGPLARDSTVVIFWNITERGKSIGHHSVVLSGHQVSSGARKDRWLFSSQLRGPVTFIGSVSVISGLEFSNSRTVSKQTTVRYLK